MAAVLVQDIVQSAIIELSQVPGASTQIYGTPRLLQYVQDAFDFCFQANWWGVYRSYITGQPDGATGLLQADMVPTTPNAVVPITKYSNIRSCFPADNNRIIREVPPRFNPLIITGTSPLYKTSDYTYPNRPIKFYPLTAADQVVMEVRQEPLHPFALTDIMYLDPLMLTLGTCYLYAADDGTNPGQINKFQSLFTKRLNDMIAAEGDTSMQLDPRFGVEQDQWWEIN